MRLEKIMAEALMRVDEDRYLLSAMVFKRVEELSKGAKPLVDMDNKKQKYVDIALKEIAKGHIKLLSVD